MRRRRWPPTGRAATKRIDPIDVKIKAGNGEMPRELDCKGEANVSEPDHAEPDFFLRWYFHVKSSQCDPLAANIPCNRLPSGNPIHPTVAVDQLFEGEATAETDTGPQLVQYP